MASQAIKEYDDFAGQDGYIIVDGLDNQTPGGKKLLSDLSAVPDLPSDAGSKNYVLGIKDGQLSWVELKTDSFQQGSTLGPVDIEYK